VVQHRVPDHEVEGGVVVANALRVSDPAVDLDRVGPELLARGSVALSGYTFSVKAANAATRVPDAPAGCEGAVSDYAAQATPVTPGSSGLRFFGTDGSSTIYQWTENGVGSPKPIK